MNQSLSNARRDRRAAALLAALAVLGLAIPGLPQASAQNPPVGKSPQATAASWVPADAKSVLHLRIADLSKNPITNRLRAPLGNPWRTFLVDMPKEFQLPPKEVESITLVMNDIPFVAMLLLPLDRFGPGKDAPKAESKVVPPEKEGKAIKEPKPPQSPKPNPTPLLQVEAKEGSLFELFEGRLVIVTTATKEAADQMLKKFSKEATAQKEMGQVFYSRKQGAGLSLFRAGERVVLMGSEKELRQAIKAGPTKQLPEALKSALDMAAEKYQVVLGLNGQDATLNGWRDLVGLGGFGRTMRTFAATNGMVLGIRFDKESRLSGHFSFPNAKAATAAVGVIEDLLFVFRLVMLGDMAGRLDEQVEEADNPKEELQAFTALLLLERMQNGLRKIQVKQQESKVTFQASAATDVAEVAKLARDELKALQTDPAYLMDRLKKRSSNNLKQIGVALHNYHGANQRFPSPNGKAMLSWRVYILPYIEQDNLYNQFKLDEPWDSPNNIKLLPMMPKIYAPIGVKTKEPHSTFYQAIVGPGAGWEMDRPLRIVDFTDGTSNTILVAEGRQAVPWTKPDDTPFDPKKPLPKFGGLFKDGFHVLFADGSVRFIRQIDDATLRAIITRNGGEVFNLDNIR